MSAHSRLTGAAMLKRLRRSRGWSLANAAQALVDMAVRLGQPFDTSIASVQRSVARWESNTSPIVPSERYQLLLAHLYAHDARGQMSLGSGSDLAELLEALGHFGVSEGRLSELRTILVRTATDTGVELLALLGPSTQAALSAALADPSHLDEGLLTAMRDSISHVNGQVGSVPFVRLQLLLAPIIESCRRLLNMSVPNVFLPDLQLISAQAYTLAGRFAFETRDDDASRALYSAATDVASSLGVPWRRAVVHMSNALVTLYSTPGLDAAKALIDAAVRDARVGQSVTVRARAHALQAEIAARAGAEKHAKAALALAWYDLDQDRATDPATSSFSPAHLRGFEGITSLYVGDPAQAHDYFANSAQALVAPRERVQRAIVSADQALARIRLGDPQSAAELLHSCIDAASETGGRVAMIRMHRARQDLRPWRREGFVADLDDHLIESLGR
ncbi:hypothetical protein [Nonomuraea wenchangensis]|uniref:hypothetical protein n=1 Tax=Nonomuraea wenchangensis TaxID=568860 RepID=UPI003331C73F